MMGIFKKKNTARISAPVTQNRNGHPFGIIDGYVPLGAPQIRLYYTLREAIPVIDAAILKIVRLTGGFEVKCFEKAAQNAM
ncbi:MAG: serine/threonine protein phosphatase, partial [Clostridia bacterium]|nr:serine/threonine protein phosphatase [Clostridia bacterium]